MNAKGLRRDYDNSPKTEQYTQPEHVSPDARRQVGCVNNHGKKQRELQDNQDPTGRSHVAIPCFHVTGQDLNLMARNR